MVGLVDEWAARFFEELDYVNEGENGTKFAEMMRKDLPQVSLMTFKIVAFSCLGGLGHFLLSVLFYSLTLVK